MQAANSLHKNTTVIMVEYCTTADKFTNITHKNNSRTLLKMQNVAGMEQLYTRFAAIILICVCNINYFVYIFYYFI